MPRCQGRRPRRTAGDGPPQNCKTRGVGDRGGFAPMFRKCDHKSLQNVPKFTYEQVESQKFSGDKPTSPIFKLGSRRRWLLAFDVGPNQSINQSFNVIFHASTGQTHTRTSRRHYSWSAASNGSKLNLFKSFSTYSFQVFHLSVCQH